MFETVPFPTIGKSHFLKNVIFLMPHHQKVNAAKVIISRVPNLYSVVKAFPNCVKAMLVKSVSRLCHSMRARFLRLRAHTGKNATGLCWQCFRSGSQWSPRISQFRRNQESQEWSCILAERCARAVTCERLCVGLSPGDVQQWIKVDQTRQLIV